MAKCPKNQVATPSANQAEEGKEAEKAEKAGNASIVDFAFATSFFFFFFLKGGIFVLASTTYIEAYKVTIWTMRLCRLWLESVNRQSINRKRRKVGKGREKSYM